MWVHYERLREQPRLPSAPALPLVRDRDAPGEDRNARRLASSGAASRVITTVAKQANVPYMVGPAASPGMDVPRYDSLDSQVVLVTGATRGIGKAIADGLVDLDATVYAGARDTDDIEATDRHAIELDVTDDDGMVAAVDRIEREQGRLDVLVNNAGVMDSREPLDGMPTDVIDQTLDTNLRGAVLMTKYAIRSCWPRRAVASSPCLPASAPSPRVSQAARRPTASRRRASTG